MKEHELVEETKLYSPDVVGISSTKRRGSSIILAGRWMKTRNVKKLSRPAMSNPRAACGPVKDFVRLRPSLGFAAVKVSDILSTCPYIYNLEFDIFDAGGP